MDDRSPPPIFSAEPAAPPAGAALFAVDDPPPRWTEIVCLLAIVLIADLAIYRGAGYAGWAAAFAATPLLLFVGAARRRPDRGVAVLGVMLLLLAAKLLWCGLPIGPVVGTALLPFFAIALVGRRPYVRDALAFSAFLIYHGGRGLAAYGLAALQFGRRFAPSSGITVVLPAAIGVAFSLLFVLANPDLVNSVSETLSQMFKELQRWLLDVSLGEIAFLFAVGWIAIAMLRPSLDPSSESADDDDRAAAVPTGELSEAAPRPMFLAWRNTLAVVILIYAVYLTFEFRTLWFREFPKGFHYSGYAHEGAAWLTIGLALATSILSLIFRGRILRDNRAGRLQRLALVWSVENLLLAAAVYHRLFIYIDFNGMTRMRFVGLYGVSSVVVGFLLVLVKIVRRHDFAWLLQRHLWTLGFFIYLYAITPVDDLAMRYNVARILEGNSAPSVQISVQPISAEGLLVLEPLLDCPDEIVRAGVAALLDERHATLQTEHTTNRHWTAYQLSESRLLDRFQSGPLASIQFPDPTHRRAAWERFRTYAYQWY